MKILAVSYVTQPDRGSEGGVGWSMLKAACELVHSRGGSIDALIDARDYSAVMHAITGYAWQTSVRIIPVSLPTLALKKFKDSRSRGGYISWLPSARKTASRLHAQQHYDVAHQFTFATASMPSAIRGLPTRTIWGPLAIALHPALRADGTATTSERLGILATKNAADYNTKTHDLVIAQNSHTAEFLRDRYRQTVIEPNIVVESTNARAKHNQSIVFSGHLIERKRPWICLQAMRDRSLKEFQLQVIGDGPLRKSLESFARLERIDHRVTFQGRMSRPSALSAVAKSTLLMLPSSREGAPWVVGEAAAMGVPSLVSDVSGAGTVVSLSGDMGATITEADDTSDLAASFARAAATLAAHDDWSPTDRWSEARMPTILSDWWGLEDLSS